MSNDSAKAGGGGLPIVFLAASAIAYFNMPEISDSVTRLVASGAVGLGTSVGGGVGAIGGMLSGVFGGAVLGGKNKYAAMHAGIIAGAVAGAGAGLYYGYDITKDYVLDAVQETAPQSEMIEQSNDGQHTFNVDGKPVTYDYQSNRVFVPG